MLAGKRFGKSSYVEFKDLFQDRWNLLSIEYFWGIPEDLSRLNIF